MARRVTWREILAGPDEVEWDSGLETIWDTCTEAYSAVLDYSLINRHITPLSYAEVEIYAKDAKIKRRSTWSVPRKAPEKRGEVKEWSRASQRNFKFLARNLTGMVALLTLTYPKSFPLDGRRVKKDWDRMRRWLVRRQLGGMWWLEFQRRGAPHFHVFLNGRVDKAEVKKQWAKIVASSDEKHARWGGRVDRIRKPWALAAYAAKYVGKIEQKTIPPNFTGCGRWWATFGGVKLTPEVVVSGELDEVTPLIRTARKLTNSNRKKGGYRPQRDNGRYGFVAYGAGPALMKLNSQARDRGQSASS